MATATTSPWAGIAGRFEDLFFDTARHRLIDVETTQDGGPVNGRVEAAAGQRMPDDGLRGRSGQDGGQGMNLVAIMVIGGMILGGVWIASELTD